MTSILDSVKSLLGIASDVTAFDVDIIIYINSVFSALNQLGIGPEETLVISDGTSEWSSFSTDPFIVGLARTYVYLRVKLLFDPPVSSTATEAINKVASEFEWRMYAACENARNSEENQNGN